MIETKDISQECTQLLPVATPSVSGYMQHQYNERLIVLLSMLCANPEQFVKDAHQEVKE